MVTICKYCDLPATRGAYCTGCGAPIAEGAPKLHDPDVPTSVRGWKRTRLLMVVMTTLLLFGVVALILMSLDGLDAILINGAAAIIPSIVLGYVILSLDRFEHEPTRAIIAAYAWGAGGAVAVALVAEMGFGWLASSKFGEQGGQVIGVTLGAPVFEEMAKGAALVGLLWLYRGELDNVTDGVIYGALIGLGFAMSENILYFAGALQDDGMRGLGELFLVRVVINGFGHSLYTALFGASIGFARMRYSRGVMRFFVPVIGLLAAILAHASWNTGTMLIAFFFGTEDSTIRTGLIGAVLIVLPVTLLVLGILWRARVNEQRVIRRQLAPEVAMGLLTVPEVQGILDLDARKGVLETAERMGGKEGKQLVEGYYQAAAELAFRKEHLSRGEPATPEAMTAITHERRIIDRSRQIMLAGATAGQAGQ